MKLTCDRQALCDSILTTSRAVSTKSTLPALEGILLTAKDGQLTLQAYDLELGIKTGIDASVEEEGATILNARILSDVVRKLAGETVTLTIDPKHLTVIESGHAKFTILGTPPDEFPEMPAVEDGDVIRISKEVLKSMIRQTIFAISQSDQKPVHTGSLFDFADGVLNVVSVDGYRLALRRETVGVDGSFRFIVPGRTLSEILKVLTDEEGDVAITVARRHAIFEIGGFRFISRLIEGDFLDYKNTIPKETKTVVRANTREFVDCVERASLLITDKLKSPLRCEFGDGKIALHCQTAIGKVYDEFGAAIDGEPVSIGFNHKYLLDALKACETDEVKVELLGPLSPMLVRPVDGDSFTFLVLPVRLKNE